MRGAATIRHRMRINFSGLTASMVLLLLLFPCCPPLKVVADSPEAGIDNVVIVPAAEKQAGEDDSHRESVSPKSSDEYKEVTADEAGGGEGLGIADPIEPWNRIVYHFNDKVYFWVWQGNPSITPL